MIGANGSVNSERRITQIEDGTMFIHFLSTETNSKLQVQGGDLLYHVINKLVRCHLSGCRNFIYLILFFFNRLPFIMALFRMFSMQLPLQRTLV